MMWFRVGAAQVLQSHLRPAHSTNSLTDECSEWGHNLKPFRKRKSFTSSALASHVGRSELSTTGTAAHAAAPPMPISFRKSRLSIFLFRAHPAVVWRTPPLLIARLASGWTPLS